MSNSKKSQQANLLACKSGKVTFLTRLFQSHIVERPVRLEKVMQSATGSVHTVKPATTVLSEHNVVESLTDSKSVLKHCTVDEDGGNCILLTSSSHGNDSFWKQNLSTFLLSNF